MTTTAIRRRKFNPDQPRDDDGKWSNGGIVTGVSVLSAEEYADLYGDEQYGDGIESDLLDAPLTLRFFDNGDSHLVFDLEDGRHQVFAEFDDGESMRDFADTIQRIVDVDLDEYANEGIEPDDRGVIEYFSTPNGELKVSRYQTGEVQIADGEDRAFDLEADEASELVDALSEMADSWDGMFAKADRAAVRPLVRDVVRELLGRKFDPSQPRDENGRFSKTGAIKKALEAFAGPHDDQGEAYFPDREGVPAGRYVEIEAGDSDGKYVMRVGHDEYENEDDDGESLPLTMNLDRDELRQLGSELSLTLLARQKPKFDPSDRQSVLLAAAFKAENPGGVAFDDDRYIDFSGQGFDAGSADDPPIDFELSESELAQLHAAVMRVIFDDRFFKKFDFGDEA